MHNITWEEVLRGDSIPVYLCFPFFMTVLLAQPCTFSSLLGSLCQGVACQEGPAWPLTPTMHLDNFPLSLKKPVSAPNESHNHSCDPATGSECPGSTDRAMPGTRVILGVRKENGWSSQAISVTFSCKLPRCSWTSWPVQHVGLTLPLVPKGIVCGCANTPVWGHERWVQGAGRNQTQWTPHHPL